MEFGVTTFAINLTRLFRYGVKRGCCFLTFKICEDSQMIVRELFFWKNITTDKIAFYLRNYLFQKCCLLPGAGLTCTDNVV